MQHEFDQLTGAEALAEFTQLAGELWRPPHLVADAARPIIDRYMPRDADYQIVVSGETTNVSFYILLQATALVLTPLSRVSENVVLRELYGESLPSGERWRVVPMDERLRARLALPRMQFINPCVLDNFPVPRLCLSVGLPAAYLRKHQKADVRILDMQMGIDVGDIVAQVEMFKPDLVGLSISYGQRDIAIDLLDRLTELKRRGVISCRFLLGNIISASNPLEFIARYPGLVIATGEGEMTAVAIAEHLKGLRPIEEVPGLCLAKPDGSLHYTTKVAVDMQSIPLPAFDTLPAIAQLQGALTVELSRGCQWNVCTFCPREHKSASWKSFSTPQIVEQFQVFKTLSQAFNIKSHLFLADEEFVGGANDLDETERLSNLARVLMDKNIGMSFDAAARVDQVIDPKCTAEWHSKRLEMWDLCQKAGMDRLFLGVESGCDSQLKRYGKGIRAIHSIRAIRLLSALGIPLRFGFITFDQLMTGFDELRENIRFLERTDAFMRPVDVEAYGYQRLFDLLTQDDDFVAAQSAGTPVAASISYMLASMEVLINSRYAQMLSLAEKRHGKRLIIDPKHYDTNMGRLIVDFLDPAIGQVSEACQRWIDRHFGLAYATKSFFKVASARGRPILMNWMVEYRQISLRLLKAMVYAIDTAQDEAEGGADMLHDQKDPAILSTVRSLRLAYASNEMTVREVCIACMNAFDRVVGNENDRLWRAINTGALQDNDANQMVKTLRHWADRKGLWRLINDSTGTADDNLRVVTA